MSALALVGLVAFPFLPIAPLPQVDFPTIQVTATLSGASAETMASSVAAPLERQFGQIAGVTQLTSLSSLGVSQVVIQFDLNRNIDLAAQDIQAAITAASKFLPQAMTYPPIYRKVNPADAPIMMLWAHSDTLPLTTVHDNLDNIFIQALSQVPGVAQASIIGDQKPSIRVQVDPAKLASIGLTLEEVRDSLVKATSNAAKGTIFTPKVGYTISTNDQITQAEAFNNVILAYRDGAALRVRDVGEAVVEASSRYVAGFPNNKPGMLLSIKKLPGANVIDAVELIKAQLSKLTANIPAAMKVETLLDRTVTIRASVHDVDFTLVLTIGLVVMVVLLFLRDFWATFIPSITVPLALLGSFAVMFMLNFSLDKISLMGLTIAVGFVVDDAIVVVENIYRHVEDGLSPFEAALKGSREIAFTVLSISFSLVAVFIPLLLMGGIMGRVFREFALTVTASIAISALVSLTLAPMLCARFMRPHTDQNGRLYGFIEARTTILTVCRTGCMASARSAPNQISAPPPRSETRTRRVVGVGKAKRAHHASAGTARRRAFAHPTKSGFTRARAPPLSEMKESLSLFQICPKDRHLEIVAAFIFLIVDEHHADKLLVDIDFGRIVFFRTRHDTQLGVAEQASHIIFQLADFLDVHGSSFAPLASRGVTNLDRLTAISARHPIQTESRGIPMSLSWRCNRVKTHGVIAGLVPAISIRMVQRQIIGIAGS
jgi:multidrug efflux pump subunit AcrB